MKSKSTNSDVYGVIYVIFCKESKKYYVGQTIQSISKRLKSHTDGKYPIGDAIRKYGIENFTIEEVDTATSREDLNEKEYLWVLKLNSMSPNGYNLTSGGGSQGKHSDETKEKRSKKLKGHKTSDETKKKISDAQKGRKVPPERIEKFRLAKLGKKQDPEMVARRNDKIREVYRLRHDEIVEKISKVHVGRKNSEETKEKMRSSAKNRKNKTSND